MASPIGTQGSISVKTDDAGSSITISISEPSGVSSENLSFSTWGASYVLANQLHKIPVPPTADSKQSPRDGRWALELGAGTGLVGLSAASIWRTNVVLTDLPNILPGVTTNISLNEHQTRRNGGSAIPGSLDWSSPDELRTYPSRVNHMAEIIRPETSKPGLILAADTIYSEEHPEILCKTISTWLASGPDSRVVLCYPLRMAYIDYIRLFWEMMDDAGFECVEEGRETGNEDWNEVANTPYEWCVWKWKD
jgi:predicted nicotinamide N-methyase